MISKNKLYSLIKRALWRHRFIIIAKRCLWKYFPLLLISPLRTVFSILLKIKIFKFFYFELLPKNYLLITNGARENYVVTTSDKIISKNLFIHNEFDLNKLIKANTILKFSNKNSLIIDVGANIGSICIPAITRNIFSKAIAIEPNPFNFFLLSLNLKLNKVENKIHLINKAAGNFSNKLLTMELSKTNFGDHRIKSCNKNGIYNEKKRDFIKVHSDTLDSILHEKIESETLIWIDTQGFEGFVLEGSKKLINKGIPMVIEFWPYGLIQSKS
jgi:FkbM family methyltransferase